jgi:hypothetical protein
MTSSSRIHNDLLSQSHTAVTVAVRAHQLRARARSMRSTYGRHDKVRCIRLAFGPILILVGLPCIRWGRARTSYSTSTCFIASTPIHDFHEFLMTFLGMIPIIDFCVFHSSHNHYDLFYDLLQLHDLLYYFHECVGFHAMAWPVLWRFLGWYLNTQAIYWIIEELKCCRDSDPRQQLDKAHSQTEQNQPIRTSPADGQATTFSLLIGWTGAHVGNLRGLHDQPTVNESDNNRVY